MLGQAACENPINIYDSDGQRSPSILGGDELMEHSKHSTIGVGDVSARIAEQDISWIDVASNVS